MAQCFVHFSTVASLQTAFHNGRSVSSIIFVFHTAAILSPFFFCTTSSSCFVKSPSLMSNWPLIFLMDSSLTSGTFLSSFLKCSSHFCSLPSWLAALNFYFRSALLSDHFLFCLQWLSWFISYRISDLTDLTMNIY